MQIQAYLDNVFDVGALLEDAETKNAALERVEELEENISHVSINIDALNSAGGSWMDCFLSGQLPCHSSRLVCSKSIARPMH